MAYIDWQFSSVGLQLSPLQFVSPPYSLRVIASATQVTLCARPETLCIPQGRIDTYLYPTGAGTARLVFRNQKAGTPPDILNCYVIDWPTTGQARFWSRVGGVDTILFTYSLSALTTATWNRYRTSWWSTLTPMGNNGMACQLEKYVGGSWIDCGTGYSEVDLWVANPTNRVGLSWSSAVGHHADDTWIYRRL